MKEAREAEIREISGTEEMMPAVSYQTPVADTCGLGMDEEGVPCPCIRSKVIHTIIVKGN